MESDNPNADRAKCQLPRHIAEEDLRIEIFRTSIECRAVAATASLIDVGVVCHQKLARETPMNSYQTIKTKNSLACMSSYDSKSFRIT